MKLTFTYRLIGRGWSEATVSDGDTSVTVTASYISDGLTGLTEALITLLAGADRASCRFAEEPGEYRWLFERRGKTLVITIRWFDDTFSSKPDEAGQLVFSAEGGLRRFAVQLSNQLQQLRERHGLDGYKALWLYDFPTQAQEKLTDLIRATRSSGPT